MQHSVGNILFGKVNNVKDNGVYVSIDNYTFGFLPNKKMPSYLNESGQFSGTRYDRVKVVIEDIRPDGMLLLCDLDYWKKKRTVTEFVSRYKPGTIFPCEVKSIFSHSATILVSNTVEGHINKEQLGWNAINKVSDVLYVGEPINAVFVGEENGKLTFSLKYLQEKPYEESLYDLSSEDLLRYCGHSGTEFIGECRVRGSLVFMENLYSNNRGEEGRILADKKFGYNLKAIVQGNNTCVANGRFYKFNLELVQKETRLERNQLFQFKAVNIRPVERNPFSDDVLQAFKKHISPATNITASHLLDEVGKNMYSSKDRMFFELVQNADDASSESGVSVSVKTEGDYLTIVHNGFSFDREDFEAITSAANGTKKANENKTGYKGIGFKSVFTDSEEVLIKTGGYQFKYQKNHPIFSSFENFYFFVNELSTQEQKNSFLDKYSSERARFNGVDDIPWQLEPIWVKRENFPALSAFQSNANVAIALKLGENKIFSEKGYQSAIEAVIDNPRFMLFLRNTNRIDFNDRNASKEIDGCRIVLKNSFGQIRQETFERKDYSVITSDKMFSEKGFDIRRKIENEREGKIIEASFVNARGQKYENIPGKLAISQSTEVSFAVKIAGEKPELNPDTGCSEVSIFAFLPTLVKEFKFPFYINANFVLDPPRQHVLSDNPWNCFLMGEIGELVVKWCAELCERHEHNALNILPANLFNERESDIAELAEAFNTRYKAALDDIPFILCGDNKLHSADEVVIDKTGLAEIVGEETYCRILGSSKHIPSSDIDCAILENELFASVEKVRIRHLATLLYGNAEINTWYQAAPKESRDAFLSWMGEYSDSLNAVIPSLTLFKFGESMVCPSDITIGNSRLITTDKIKPIKDILEKIGFNCSEHVENESALKPFAPAQPFKKIFEALSSREQIKDLSTEDKLKLIRYLAQHESIDPSSIASLTLFHNMTGAVKPLNAMIAYAEGSPEWIKPFMINEKENNDEIQPYLVPCEQAFEKLILPRLSDIQADIKTLYLYFKWTDARISAKVIDFLKSDNKTDTFINVVKDLGKDTKKYYLQSITRLDISERSRYSKESYEYKVLQLAIDTYEEPSVFSDSVYVGDKCLKDFSIRDEVVCEYTSLQAKHSVCMSLSRLLPDYENQSEKIESVKALFDSSLAWDKLVKSKRKTAEWVETELNKVLGIVHASYEPWRRGAGNAQQYLFSVYRRRMSWITVKGFAIKLEDESDNFINELMDFLYTKGINISNSPFTCRITGYFTRKYFDNSCILEEEQLLPSIERWANDDKKKDYLLQNGIRTQDNDVIAFRKAFIADAAFPRFDELDDADKKSSMTFLVATETVNWPVSGEHQIEYLNKILDLRLTPLKESVDLETLKSESTEMSTASYISWIADSFPKIFLFDGPMPIVVTHGDYPEDILMRKSSGTYYYDESGKVLYVDKNVDIEDSMFNIARNNNRIPFNLDDYSEVFRIGMTSISTEEIEQTKQKIEDLMSELSAKEQLLSRYRQRYGDIDAIHSSGTPVQFPDEVDVTIKKGEQDGLSIDEQVAAQLEAQQFLKRVKSKWQFPQHYAEADENGEPYCHSTVEVVNENGIQIPIVLKSHRDEGEPLKLNTFECDSIFKDNATIYVYTGNEIKTIKAKDLIMNQHKVNISFSTENLDIEERISAFADSLHYFKELHFDFDSFNLSRMAKSISDMDNMNDRHQIGTSDNDL